MSNPPGDACSSPPDTCAPRPLRRCRPQADGTVDPDTDPEYIAQVMFALIPCFILQRMLLGDVTPDSFCAGLSALLPRPAPEPTST
jgi:hypothetical protein